MEITSIISNESGQASVDYMCLVVLAVTLCFIFFMFVPYFADGFDVVLKSVLAGDYKGQ